MEKEIKTDFSEKCMLLAPRFFAVAIFLCAAFLVIGEMIFPDERRVVETDCRVFEAEWYRILENGDRVKVEVPGKVDAQWGEVVRLVTTLPEGLHKGENLCFRPIWQDADIYVDGVMRESYNTDDTRPFGTNSAFQYVFVELTEEDSGKELVYEFWSESKYAGTIKKIYIGDRASLWFRLIEDAGGKATAALCLGLMGFFCIIICLILRFAYRKPLELRYLSWAIFLCAWWMLSEVEFRQLIIKNVSVWTNGTYWSLMLIAFPLLVYMNEIQKGHYRKLYAVTIVYSVCMLIIGTILQVFDVVQFVTQLPFIHAGLLLAIISIIATITIDTVNKRIKEYLLVGIGIYGMLLSAVLEMVAYYLQLELSLGTLLAVGLMFLLVMAIIKTGQDLLSTEKKKQEAIVAKEAQAKFLANMSHEIRTPLNAIIGMNEMVLRENENETIHEYAQNIHSASNMLLELINDILDLSKIESGQLEIVNDTYDLQKMLRDEKLLMDARIGDKPIETVIEVDPEIPHKLIGDEVRVKQILTNLLSNAVKYTKEGTITFKVFYKCLDENSISLCFSVADTGQGIKKEELPHLFEQFKRLDINKNRNVEGTGLGLNIVRQLVYLMKGDIQVESEYGKGSTFTVCLPQKVASKEKIGNLEKPIEKNRNEVKKETENAIIAPDAKVLVVDDNSMNLKLMQALLKRTRMQVDIASSGKESLEMTRKKAYHLILMDHMMPEMDGVETLRRIRAEQSNCNQNTPVIALTANAVAGCREMYLDYGFDDYFSKPIQADKLEEMLLQYLPKGLVETKMPMHQETTVLTGDGNSDQPALANAQYSVQSAESKDGNPNQPAFTKPESAVQSERVKAVAPKLLEIDRELGLSYCRNMEELYAEILVAFCEEVESTIPELDSYFRESNWEKYAMAAHGLKGNALNIGASNLSELSLQHERAGKEQNADFIKAEYAGYIAALKAMTDKLRSESGR